MKDFNPGTVIESEMMNGVIHLYTVLDPARTRGGKLRLKGPRDGYQTTWWTPKTLHIYSRNLRIKKSA